MHRGVAESLLIFLVQQVTQASVDVEATRQPVRKAGVGKKVASGGEQALQSEGACGTAVVRFKVKNGPSDGGIRVQGQPTVPPCDVVAP